MNTIRNREELTKELQDKEIRDFFVSDHINVGIPLQVRALREQRGWTQKELAERAGMKQERISAIENPNYKNAFTLSTLIRLASAYDVALIVRFVPISELVKWELDLSPEKLEAVSFDEDPYFKPRPSLTGTAYATATGTNYITATATGYTGDTVFSGSCTSQIMVGWESSKSIIYMNTGTAYATATGTNYITAIASGYIGDTVFSGSCSSQIIVGWESSQSIPVYTNTPEGELCLAGGNTKTGLSNLPHIREAELIQQ